MRVNEVKRLVESYIKSEKSIYPFFLVVGDEDYTVAKAQLAALVEVVSISSYCVSADRFPNLDDFYNDLQDGKMKAVVGLGEYLALKGEQDVFDTLSKLKDFPLNGGRVILLLRCVTDTVKKLQSNDLRFDSTQNRVAYIGSCKSSLSLTRISAQINLSNTHNGLKAVLAVFEDGDMVNTIVKTKIPFQNSLIEVRDIASAYDGIKKHLLPAFAVASEYGNDEQWGDFLAALTEAKGNLSHVFDNYGLPVDLISCFNKFIHRIDFMGWLYFVALKLKARELENAYLRYILEMGTKFADFKDTVINAIINIKHTDTHFEKFYEERTELVKHFSPHEIAAFVDNNKVDPADGLYKLTDNTQTECEEFIALFNSLDKEFVLKRVKRTYPALYSYLQPYIFSDPKINEEMRDLLTNYFNKYKWQKVLNYIDDEFVNYVETLAMATERKYNLLPSRNDIVSGIGKDGVFLYWIDALGVEFLGFIQATCKQLNLKLKIHIGRAELPTITSENKDFYETWQNTQMRYTDKRLDEAKHKEEGRYNYENKKLPVHIVSELKIIAEILSSVAVMLNANEYKKCLIVSDHGASRLAVIKEQEEKYETDTKGLHSGRCCKTPANYAYDLPFATQEGEYLVLANYGRFKNSRRANVEVHGGASLEEVVIPIIEITLANPKQKVQFQSDTVFVDYKTPAVLVIFSNTAISHIKVVIDGKPYVGVKTGDKYYSVNTDIKKAKTYTADIYDGDSFVCKLEFTAQGKNKSNSDFDF
jgi:hypothetical protein